MIINELPLFLEPYIRSQAMQRLAGIDNNCGVNRTSFPLFAGKTTCTRYHHSILTSLLAWHFTHDTKQALACLFHDIASPVFSHTVDFAEGDLLKQETTERGIAEILSSDPIISSQLKQDGMSIDDVCDYHRYPICDNHIPQLSCDRLSYMLTGMNELFCVPKEKIISFVDDITVSKNEYGEEELCFQNKDIAVEFTRFCLQCGIIYACCFDRFAMMELADLVNDALSDGVLVYEDLYTTESYVIDKLKNSTYHDAWRRFESLCGVYLSEKKIEGYRQIRVKKRYVDPYVIEMGRVSMLDHDIRRSIDLFVNDDQMIYIKGRRKTWKKQS